METLLTVLHVIFCLFLIMVILLQTGKGAGMGTAFGGSSGTVFGPRGAGSFIGKITGVVAALFMVTSLTLAYLSSSSATGLAEKADALAEKRASDVQEVDLAQAAAEAAALEGDAGQSIDPKAVAEAEGPSGDAAPAAVDAGGSQTAGDGGAQPAAAAGADPALAPAGDASTDPETP